MNINGNIVPVNIEEEMKVAYMDYAMSVIIGRALADVRDGLKPVHRRILYAMQDLGNSWNKPYKKSARVVGDVIGKYHPHGDSAVYEAIVRMAQNFSMRALLIDGQGNFGSVDGDSAAAMRYTEIRMSQLTHELLEDLDKETVEFGSNYDETLKEPLVLPAKYPNLLINGSSGIAVGMASNIPPHNLKETIDGVIALINNPDISIRGLMEHIKGPDFPTAGFIYGKAGIDSAYHTGRGSIKLRGRYNIEQEKEKESIIVTELPYQVNKARLIEKIAELVKEKKIEGITDLRDESDRKGMRIVITLRRGENAEVIVNQLYKHTQLQESFGVIFLAIVDKQPKILDLKTILTHFINHRIEVITRRTVFDLKKAEERSHILKGIKIAIEDIDNVVKIIRRSKSPDEAKSELMSALSIDEIQAKSILDMRLQRLTGLERQKILDELAELVKQIEYFNMVLSDKDEKYKVIKSELEEVKEKYGDERRTEIIYDEVDFNVEDLIADEEMVISVTHGGYIKRNPLSIYRSQRRGGTGSKAMTVRDEDFAEEIFIASTHTYVMFFTSSGRVHWKKVYEIPQISKVAKGKSLAGLLNLKEGEKVNATVAIKEFNENEFLIMATEQGVIKKTALSAFKNPRAGGIVAINLDANDKLIGVQRSNGDQKVFLGTKKGKAILFNEKDVRDVGRTARGVRGISLSRDNIVEEEVNDMEPAISTVDDVLEESAEEVNDDSIILTVDDIVMGMEVVNDDSVILTVTENGYGKRTKISDYRLVRRGGKGVKNIKVTEKNGLVSGIIRVSNEDDIMVITGGGTLIRMKVKEISIIGRVTQGVRLIDTKSDRKVIGVARVEEEDVELEENNNESLGG